MNLRENFLIVLRNLKENKVRAILTILGIIFGVASIIIMISMTEGNRKWIMMTVAQLGSKNIECRYDFSKRKTTSSKLITMKDIEQLSKQCHFVKKAVPLMKTDIEAIFERNKDNFQIIGTTEDIKDILKINLEQGRYFKESDTRQNYPVCILGYKVQEKLFKNLKPLDKDIILKFKNKRIRFYVIGILEEEKGWSYHGINDSIIIPYKIMKNKLTQIEDFSYFTAEATDFKTVEYAEAQIKKFMEKRNIPIYTWTPKKFLETNMEFQHKLTLFGFFISGISLLIGGIGIMNIMLISVMERIREIGIRRAVGASEKDILRQFLTEAVFIGIIGGIIGIPLGVIGALIFGISFEFNKVMSLYSIVSIPSIFIAVMFAIIISATFAYYPAKKAAKLDPIEALRYE